MTDNAKTIIGKIRELEQELVNTFSQKSDELQYRIENRRIIFEDEIIRRHKTMKQHVWSYIKGARLSVILTAPFIYAVIIPFVLLDIFVSIYQAICFPAYGIEKVKRKDHIIFDRQKLAYLNGVEKFNCIYCAYGNGLLAFASEIAARTERRWCPIKHVPHPAKPHDYYWEFAEFGDAEDYRTLKERDEKSAKTK